MYKLVLLMLAQGELRLTGQVDEKTTINGKITTVVYEDCKALY